MAADREKRDYVVPPSGKTYKKVRAVVSCPRCKEDYWAYINKKGKKKGIRMSQQWRNALMSSNADYRERHEDKRIYQCNVCGFKWEVKEIYIF